MVSDLGVSVTGSSPSVSFHLLRREAASPGVWESAPSAQLRRTWPSVTSRELSARPGAASPRPGRRCRPAGFASSSSALPPGPYPGQTGRKSHIVIVVELEAQREVGGRRRSPPWWTPSGLGAMIGRLPRAKLETRCWRVPEAGGG